MPRYPTLAALIALLAFGSFTLFTLVHAEQTLLQFGRELLARPDTAQVVIDLYLMAVLGGIWMYRDARAKGRSWRSLLPYWLLTAVFVSLGPLLYLVVEGFRAPCGHGAGRRQGLS